MKKILKWGGIAFIVLIVVTALSGSPTKDTNVSTKEKPEANEDAVAKNSNIKVESFKIVSGDYGTRYIEGVAVNTSSRRLSYVGVSFTLHDAEGVQIGETLENTTELDAGGKWKFKAYVTENEATEARLKEVTTY